VRLDVLLFGLRLFKSRSQAAAAVQEGRVLLNGAQTKPAHEARAGDRVTLQGPGGRDGGTGRARTLEVLGLPRGSLSKAAARDLVRELPADAD
jgi:ribosome-associated heat shock protein Hsp15